MCVTKLVTMYDEERERDNLQRTLELNIAQPLNLSVFLSFQFTRAF